MTRTATRLAKADRRTHLLDVAAAIAIERGPGAVTIERVAADAGVSRALAYQHFANADEVLVALYRREVAGLADAVLAAVDRVTSPEARLRAAIGTFLDTVGARGGLFTVLAATGSPVPAVADDGTRAGERFTAALLARIFDLPARRARTAGALTLGALIGGFEALAAGEATRREVEEALVAMTLAVVGEGRR